MSPQPLKKRDEKDLVGFCFCPECERLGRETTAVPIAEWNAEAQMCNRCVIVKDAGEFADLIVQIEKTAERLGMSEADVLEGLTNAVKQRANV